MRYIIRFHGSHSLYRGMKPSGPEATTMLAEACVFDSKADAQKLLKAHYARAAAVVEILDEIAYSDAVAAANAPQIRQQYLGVLGLLAECSVHLRSPEANELRALIEEAFIDASGVIPSFRWKRILDGFDVQVANTTASPKAESR